VLAVGFVALVLAAAAPCAAQVELVPTDLEVPLVVGIGVGVIPDYEGSDEYTFGIAPFFRWTFQGERYVQLRANELSVNVLNSKYFQFGPLAAYKFGRSDVDDDVVDRMEDVDDTVELGAFGAFVLRNQQNVRQRFIADVDFLHDVGGVSESFRFSLGARYWHPVARRLDLMLGVRSTFVTDDYMNTYFGVSSTDAARSGLPAFSADGGGKDVSVTLGSLFYLTESWVLGAGIRYSRLLGDAADSPIVDGRGSADQIIAGLAVGYMWGRPATARP
jgi:outer membrane protein